jgi:hydrogenase maturation protease
MSDAPADVLLLCYGNPGRLDDGLGAGFAELVEGMGLPGVTVDVDYQLNVEQAADAAQHRYLVFVDAAVQGREPFFFRPMQPGSETAFSTHSVEPEGLLALAGKYFGSVPEAYALGIRGYEFNEFGEVLSPRAIDNLTAAVQFMLPVLEKRSFASAAVGCESAASDGERECKTEST